MLKFLCSNGLRAIAVMACLCSAAIADDVPAVQGRAALSSECGQTHPGVDDG